MEVCEEMQKLRDWLDEKKIEWEDHSETSTYDKEFNPWICRTWFYINNKRISVINGYYTYGGISIIDGKNEGLLEVMGLIGNGVIGHMTAGDVIAAIKVIFDSKSEDK